jgi:hypothetical protein
MGWEDRNGRSYYYRKERDGGRVRSVYVGGGEVAGLIAQLDAADADDREGERSAARRECELWQEQETELDAIAEMMDAIATGVLLAAGYHTHKRQWRLQRHG